MSSGLSILIIVILIAIIAVIATVVILNKYFNHQIAELDALTDELKDLSVEEDIKRLQKMELAGKSLETFKRWQKVYQKVCTRKTYYACNKQYGSIGWGRCISRFTAES